MKTTSSNSIFSTAPAADATTVIVTRGDRARAISLMLGMALADPIVASLSSARIGRIVGCSAATVRKHRLYAEVLGVHAVNGFAPMCLDVKAVPLSLCSKLFNALDEVRAMAQDVVVNGRLSEREASLFTNMADAISDDWAALSRHGRPKVKDIERLQDRAIALHELCMHRLDPMEDFAY